MVAEKNWDQEIRSLDSSPTASLCLFDLRQVILPVFLCFFIFQIQVYKSYPSKFTSHSVTQIKACKYYYSVSSIAQLMLLQLPTKICLPNILLQMFSKLQQILTILRIIYGKMLRNTFKLSYILWDFSFSKNPVKIQDA